MPCLRIRQGPGLVAEQLAGDDAGCQGRAVDRHQQPAAPRAQLVNRSRHQFFTRARLAEN
jgi:hypothetical protein